MPLFQESGGSEQDRTNEAIHIWKIIQDLDHSDLSDKDAKFIDELRDRLHTYGASTHISPKQLFWLRDIKDKLLG